MRHHSRLQWRVIDIKGERGGRLMREMRGVSFEVFFKKLNWSNQWVSLLRGSRTKNSDMNLAKLNCPQSGPVRTQSRGLVVVLNSKGRRLRHLWESAQVQITAYCNCAYCVKHLASIKCSICTGCVPLLEGGGKFYLSTWNYERGT